MFNLKAIQKELEANDYPYTQETDNDDEYFLGVMLMDSECNENQFMIYPDKYLLGNDGNDFDLMEQAEKFTDILRIIVKHEYNSKEYDLREMGAHPGLYYSPVHNDIRTMDDWIRFICGDTIEDKERRRYASQIPAHEKEIMIETQRQKMSNFAFNKVIKVECEVGK